MIHATIMWNKTTFKYIAPITAIVATTGVFCSSSESRKSYRLYATNKSDSWYSSLFSNKLPTEEEMGKKKFLHTVFQTQEYTKTVSEKKSPGSVSWFETNHYNANNPIEDRHCECYLRYNDAYFFGIFDGHSGWHCSESLRTRLPLYISLALLNDKERNVILNQKQISNDMVDYLSNPSDDCLSFQSPNGFEDKQKRLNSGSFNFATNVSPFAADSSTNEVIKYAFLSLDRDISKEAIPDGICNEPIWTGLSGAVAIGVYIKNQDLYVANTGDCRAVLGVKKESLYSNIPMSEDHTAENINEVERLQKSHPGEEATVIRHQRLLGQLQPLRSFGDVVYKWSKELHREVLDIIYSRPVVAKAIYRTPPYLTAQPDVQHKRLDENDRFLIIASDGLWDTVSNERAVAIISQYLDEVELGKTPEENGATKLLKYALGQGNEQQLNEMVKLPGPIKRNYHDDITVTIIYFHRNMQPQKAKL